MTKLNSKHVFRLTDSERDSLACTLDKVAYDPHGGERYINSIRFDIAAAIPKRIAEVLQEQKTSLQPHPYIIFENLPVDDQIFTTPSPEAYSPSAKSGSRSENLLIGFASLVGEPYAIKHEGDGIVNNLIPTNEGRKEYTGLGSEVELDFHIENAALKFMGDYDFSPLSLLLSGVRHDPNGPMTRLSDARLALQTLASSDVECLRQPLYRIKLPYRWRKGVPLEASQTQSVPLVRGLASLPDISAVFYPDMVEPQTKDAALAMDNFYTAIKAHSFAIDVTPGRLVYIDNRFTLHSRDRFAPTLDETGRPLRWVQRTFVATNLWNHRHLVALESRIFGISDFKSC